jgi:hypothetical protein
MQKLLTFKQTNLKTLSRFSGRGKHQSKSGATLMFHNMPDFYGNKVALGSAVVFVLAIVPKVRGFKPGRGRWIFKGDKSP